MLLEALLYAASLPGTPAFARPHLAEAVGLWARGRRQRRAWANHNARTRAFIADAIGDGGGTVLVLGSGPLHDIPLDALAAGFSSVVLVDRVHLLPARRSARRHGNVRLEWRDLSLPEALAFAEALGSKDRVISVNLLSQLGVGAAEGKERLAIDAHLSALEQLKCPVTLITDRTYRVCDRSGAEVEHFDLLHGRPMPAPDARWLWEVAPLGEESANTSRVHEVLAYADWHAATAR